MGPGQASETWLEKKKERERLLLLYLHKLLYIRPRWIIQPSTWYGELAALQKMACPRSTSRDELQDAAVLMPRAWPDSGIKAMPQTA